MARVPLSGVDFDVDRDLLDDLDRNLAHNFDNAFFRLDDGNLFDLDAFDNLLNGDFLDDLDHLLDDLLDRYFLDHFTDLREEREVNPRENAKSV